MTHFVALVSLGDIFTTMYVANAALTWLWRHNSTHGRIRHSGCTLGIGLVHIWKWLHLGTPTGHKLALFDLQNSTRDQIAFFVN